MTTQTRATKGGEVGLNGEFYVGGTFLPSTTLGKMKPSGRKSGSGKQQIGRCRWEVAPEGMTSLFAKFRNLINWQTGQVNEQGCAYYGVSVGAVKNMKVEWEAGKVWVAK